MKAPRLSEYIKNICEDNVKKMYNYNQPLTLVSILKYTQFLTQQLNIGMFVPAKEVNGKWKVLEEPKIVRREENGNPVYLGNPDEYQQALGNVIFKGWQVESFRMSSFVNIINENRVLCWKIKGNSFFAYNGKTIEDIIHLVELNDKTVKELGL